ncbi:MAG: ATP-binding protein [Elusimicrobiota bacterium]
MDALEKELFSAIFEQSEEPVLSLDARGNIRTVSRGAQELLGISTPVKAGSSWDSLLTRDDDETQRLDFSLMQKNPVMQNFETVLLAADLRRVPVFVTTRPLGTTAGAVGGFIVWLAPEGVRLDLDARSQALREAIMRLERLGAAGQLAASFAHQMRNPIQIIQSTAEFALEYLEPSSKIVESLQTVTRNAERLSQMTAAMLNLSKSGKCRLEKGDLNLTVEAAVMAMESVCKRQNVSLEKRLQPVAAVMQDTHVLQGAIYNLLANSVEAMPDGGTLVVKVAALGGDGIGLSISDTGHGIEGRFRQQIGKPFFSTKSKGTGLGLYIVRQIALQHNAKMKVESVPGKGTLVTLVFKAAP